MHVWEHVLSFRSILRENGFSLEIYTRKGRNLFHHELIDQAQFLFRSILRENGFSFEIYTRKGIHDARSFLSIELTKRGQNRSSTIFPSSSTFLPRFYARMDPPSKFTRGQGIHDAHFGKKGYIVPRDLGGKKVAAGGGDGGGQHNWRAGSPASFEGKSVSYTHLPIPTTPYV